MKFRHRIVAAIGYVVMAPVVAWILIRGNNQMPDPSKPTKQRVSGKPPTVLVEDHGLPLISIDNHDPVPSPEPVVSGRQAFILIGFAIVFGLVLYAIRSQS